MNTFLPEIRDESLAHPPDRTQNCNYTQYILEPSFRLLMDDSVWGSWVSNVGLVKLIRHPMLTSQS